MLKLVKMKSTSLRCQKDGIKMVKTFTLVNSLLNIKVRYFYTDWNSQNQYLKQLEHERAIKREEAERERQKRKDEEQKKKEEEKAKNKNLMHF